MTMNVDTEEKYVNIIYNFLKRASNQTKKLDKLISTVNSLPEVDSFNRTTLNSLISRGALDDVEIDDTNNTIRLKTQAVIAEITRIDELLKNCDSKWKKDNGHALLWKRIGLIFGALLAIPAMSEFQILQNQEFISGILAAVGAIYVLLEKTGITPLKSETHYRNNAEKFRELKIKISDFKVKKLPSFLYKSEIIKLKDEYDTLDTN